MITQSRLHLLSRLCGSTGQQKDLVLAAETRSSPPPLDTIPKIMTNPACALLTLSRNHLYTPSMK